VSLIHTVRGYHAENAFHLNAIVFFFFVFASYRLAKDIGGELFGVAAAILVAASPNTLVAARSAGFDFLAAFLLLVVIHRFRDYAKAPSPRALALLTLSLCLLAHVRVEGLGLVAAALLALFSLRIFRWSHVRGFGFVYSLCPVFLVSRYWQSVAKADDAEQPLSSSLFGVAHFVQNVRDYLGLVAHPLQFDGPHSPLLMICAGTGCAVFAFRLVRSLMARTLPRTEIRFAVFVGVLVAAEVVLSFSYAWGQASQPASARLFIWLDTLLAFFCAWLVILVAKRLVELLVAAPRAGTHAAVTTLACIVLFVMHVPVASEARFVNALILTRQAAQEWRFFEKLGEKRILVLTDRPGLFTIMDYGARDISAATADRNCLLELSRHLYKDIYLIQEMDLDTKKPRPGFAAWPDVPTESVLDFQNTDSTSIRISRVAL
jgi:4-amino-4-deoxy-L-arabinose transferase-like glycosyltransferase